jgi:hypothetical protein
MPSTAAQIEPLAGLERRRVAASLKRRHDELADLLHDDFVFIHSNGRGHRNIELSSLRMVESLCGI